MLARLQIDSPGSGRVPLGKCALAVLLAVAASIAVGIAAGDGGDDAQEAERGSKAIARLAMFQKVYEAGTVVRGEISLTNPTREWIEIPDAASLAQALRLELPSGEMVAPERADRFGAARTQSLGPGGFVGLTFDAALLFPALTRPGRYTLHFEPPGSSAISATVRIIEAYSPDRDYRLRLELPQGSIAIDLFEQTAPVAVHNIVNLTRTDFYDNAAVPRVQKGVALAIVGPMTSAHKIVPFERTPQELIAGTVVVEPRTENGQRVNYPSLIVLLAPQPSWRGRYTVVGQVVDGLDALTRAGEIPTSGPAGRPPFRPLEPMVVLDAAIDEASPRTTTGGAAN